MPNLIHICRVVPEVKHTGGETRPPHHAFILYTLVFWCRSGSSYL